tara:strand:- start:2415 stop:3206 length:792 start_codon:yes stop_codon:yes gene_type:complete
MIIKDLDMETQFKNKMVMVTGGSKGIGFAAMETFHRLGAMVTTCARNVDDIKINGDRFFKLAGDIKDPAFIKEFHNSSTEFFGRSVDILINNNGGPPPGPSLDFNDKDWLEAINGNLLSTIRMTKLVVPEMKNNNWGRIINLTSTTAKEPAVGLVLSNVTRAAVVAFSKTISHEIGPSGITVNSILTGGVATERFNSLIQTQIENSGQSEEEIMERIHSNIPMRYISSPEEFAKFIIFIASEDASYLTGSAISIDGGATKSIF